jgi:hypothetical protein
VPTFINLKKGRKTGFKSQVATDTAEFTPIFAPFWCDGRGDAPNMAHCHDGNFLPPAGYLSLFAWLEMTDTSIKSGRILVRCRLVFLTNPPGKSPSDANLARGTGPFRLFQPQAAAEHPVTPSSRQGNPQQVLPFH